MDLKKRVSSTIVSVVVLGLSSAANAIPTLQLGITGGTYDTTTKTSIASSSTFSLYAYLIADAANPIGDTYAVSMSVSPQVDSAASLGSFTVNGDIIDVTSGMIYGIPPLDATVETTPGGDNIDLQTHGVFPTFFIERLFNFSASAQTAAFNTADDPASGPQLGTGMYFQQFDVDVSNLDEGYAIHFDLYNTKLVTEETCTGKKPAQVCTTTGELDITQFAPFSHDAQSGPGGDDGGGGNEVPEPGSMLLLSLGLLGLGWRRSKAS